MVLDNKIYSHVIFGLSHKNVLVYQHICICNLIYLAQVWPLNFNQAMCKWIEQVLKSNKYTACLIFAVIISTCDWNAMHFQSSVNNRWWKALSFNFQAQKCFFNTASVRFILAAKPKMLIIFTNWIYCWLKNWLSPLHSLL